MSNIRKLIPPCLDSLEVRTRQKIQSALSAYGKTLIEPASSAFEKLDVVEVTNRNPPEYSVWFHLWTKEEGLSDLSLQLTVADLGSDKLRIELDDIHAL